MGFRIPALLAVLCFELCAQSSSIFIETIAGSVNKTGRCVILHEATRTSGYGAELSALVQEHCFYRLEAPIERVTGSQEGDGAVEGKEVGVIPHPIQLLGETPSLVVENVMVIRKTDPFGGVRRSTPSRQGPDGGVPVPRQRWRRQQPRIELAGDADRRANDTGGLGLELRPELVPVNEIWPDERGNQRNDEGDCQAEQRRLHGISP